MNSIPNYWTLPQNIDPQDQGICDICHNTIRKVASLAPCNHMFDESCIKDWFNENPICPKCSIPAKLLPSKNAIAKKKRKLANLQNQIAIANRMGPDRDRMQKACTEFYRGRTEPLEETRVVPLSESNPPNQSMARVSFVIIGLVLSVLTVVSWSAQDIAPHTYSYQLERENGERFDLNIDASALPGSIRMSEFEAPRNYRYSRSIYSDHEIHEFQNPLPKRINIRIDPPHANLPKYISVTAVALTALALFGAAYLI